MYEFEVVDLVFEGRSFVVVLDLFYIKKLGIDMELFLFKNFSFFIVFIDFKLVLLFNDCKC